MRIPTEILDMILETLKSDGEFEALTCVARASRTMYDIAIPKIYETVVVSERNRSTVGYGHGSGASVSKQGHGSVSDNNTRKDKATGFTRRLVFEFEPDVAIAKSYRSVHEVVFSPQLLINARRSNHPYGHGPSEEDRLNLLFNKCLKVVTSFRSLAASVHIQVHLTSRLNYDIVGSQCGCFKSAVPTTWEFFGASVDYGNNVFDYAPWLHAVVYFDKDLTVSKSELFQTLGWQLGRFLLVERPSQPFCLSGIPEIVLSVEELGSAINMDEAAMVKLTDLVSVYNRPWPDQVGSSQEEKLEFLKSRVKLVKAGFKPSPVDMVDTRQTRQTQTISLVLDDSGPAPIDLTTD